MSEQDANVHVVSVQAAEYGEYYPSLLGEQRLGLSVFASWADDVGKC